MKNLIISKKNSILNIIPIIITIIIFLLLSIKIDFIRAFIILANSDFLLICLSIILSIFTNFFLTAKIWHLILKELGCNITFKKALYIRIASYPIKSILPLKSGDLTRALYLKKKGLFSFKKSIGSLLFLETLIFLGLLFILFLGIIFGRFLHFKNNEYLFTFLIFPFLVLPFFVFKISKIRNLVYKLLNKINHKVYKFINDLGIAFRVIPLIKILYLLLFSVLLLFLVFTNYYILFRAVNINIPFITVIIYSPLILIISQLPITFSGLGIRESVILLLYFSFVSPESLFGAGLLISFIDYLLPAFVGLFFVKGFTRVLLSKKI